MLPVRRPNSLAFLRTVSPSLKAALFLPALRSVDRNPLRSENRTGTPRAAAYKPVDRNGSAVRRSLPPISPSPPHPGQAPRTRRGAGEERLEVCSVRDTEVRGPICRDDTVDFRPRKHTLRMSYSPQGRKGSSTAGGDARWMDRHRMSRQISDRPRRRKNGTI